MNHPALELYDHQSALTLDLECLEQLAKAALPEVLSAPGTQAPVLPELETVEVSFVDDPAIAQVHADFLDDPTPTDVITFEHGEILISTDTAIRQGAEHGQAPERETALYLIHGLLHLNGHEDASKSGAAGMKRLQEEILNRVWPPDGVAGLTETGD